MSKWVIAAAVLLMAGWPSGDTAAADSFRADLAGSMALRSGIGGEMELDSPGVGLRIDFGRHIGVGFWLMASVSWARLSGNTPDAESCLDCTWADNANSVLGGMGFRYVLPIPDVEMFIQAGLGYLLDIVDKSGGKNGDPPAGFNQQPAFMGSVGVGFELLADVSLGFRVDTWLGSDLDALSLGCYTGIRF